MPVPAPRPRTTSAGHPVAAAALALALAAVPATASAGEPAVQPALVAPVSTALARAAELPRLEHSFIEEHLPAQLLERGPRGLRWWQWLALPVVVLLALLLGSLLGWLTRRALGHLAARTETTWDDLLIERLRRPITVFWALVVASASLPALALDEAFGDVLARGLKAGFFLVAFWGAFRAIDVGFRALAEAPSSRANPALRGSLPLLPSSLSRTRSRHPHPRSQRSRQRRRRLRPSPNSPMRPRHRRRRHPGLHLARARHPAKHPSPAVPARRCGSGSTSPALRAACSP